MVIVEAVIFHLPGSSRTSDVVAAFRALRHYEPHSELEKMFLTGICSGVQARVFIILVDCSEYIEHAAASAILIIALSKDVKGLNLSVSVMRTDNHNDTYRCTNMQRFPKDTLQKWVCIL